ncbi:hypothetical protein QQ045_030973 [Rhodiola kirilowii]
MALSKSLGLSIRLLIFILYACIKCDTTHSQNSLIKSVCETTNFPTTCEIILNSTRRYPTTTIYNLGEITMDLIEQHSQGTLDWIDRLKQTTNTSRRYEIEELNLCRLQYTIIFIKTHTAHADWYNHESNALNVVLTAAESNLNAVRKCENATRAFELVMSQINMKASRYSHILKAICHFASPLKMH